MITPANIINAMVSANQQADQIRDKLLSNTASILVLTSVNKLTGLSDIEGKI